MNDLRPVFYIILHVLLRFLISNTTYWCKIFKILYYFDINFWLNYTYIHEILSANGREQIQMGVYGCGWMRWVAGGTGDTKTRQAGGIYGCAGQDLDPMVREISPDIMFWAFWRKRSKMGKYGCGSVRMGAIGCGDTGRSKNKIKRAKNSRAGHVFECLHTEGKYRKSAGIVMVD